MHCHWVNAKSWTLRQVASLQWARVRLVFPMSSVLLAARILALDFADGRRVACTSEYQVCTGYHITLEPYMGSRFYNARCCPSEKREAQFQAVSSAQFLACCYQITLTHVISHPFLTCLKRKGSMRFLSSDSYGACLGCLRLQSLLNNLRAPEHSNHGREEPERHLRLHYRHRGKQQHNQSPSPIVPSGRCRFCARYQARFRCCPQTRRDEVHPCGWNTHSGSVQLFCRC